MKQMIGVSDRSRRCKVWYFFHYCSVTQPVRGWGEPTNKSVGDFSNSIYIIDLIFFGILLDLDDYI